MKIKDIKHRPIVGLEVTNGWVYETILGNSVICKTLDNKFNLYTYNRGIDLDFFKEDDSDGNLIIKDFKSKKEAEQALLKQCNTELQKALFYITAEHQLHIEGFDL